MNEEQHRDDVPLEFGIDPTRADELRQVISRIVKDDAITSTTEAIMALMRYIPADNRNELAFVCTEFGYALGKTHSLQMVIMGVHHEPVKNFRKPFAQA